MCVRANIIFLQHGSSMKSDKKLLFGFIIHFPSNHILKRETFSSLLLLFFLPLPVSLNIEQCAQIQNHHVINISFAVSTWQKKLIIQYANIWNPSWKRARGRESFPGLRVPSDRKSYEAKRQLWLKLIQFSTSWNLSQYPVWASAVSIAKLYRMEWLQKRKWKLFDSFD